MAADDFLAICDVIGVPYDYFNTRPDQDWKEAKTMQAIIVNGTAEEIATLALAVQERQRKEFIPSDSKAKCMDIMQKCDCWCSPIVPV